MQVLVPVDQSPQSWDALEHALDRFPGADVVVLTVLDPTEALLSRSEPYAGGHQDRLRERTEAVFEEARDVAALFDAEVRTEVVEGDPASQIVEYVDEHGIDHVVMGRHGRSGISRILLGSTAERVVRRAAVPVTVVR